MVCKAHGVNITVKMFKENILIDNMTNVASAHGDIEILKLILPIPFSDEAFKLYTCQIEDANGTIQGRARVRQTAILKIQAIIEARIPKCS